MHGVNRFEAELVDMRKEGEGEGGEDDKKGMKNQGRRMEDGRDG